MEHDAFGRGLVLSVRPMGGDALLEVAFDTVGTKKLMLKAASHHLKNGVKQSIFYKYAEGERIWGFGSALTQAFDIMQVFRFRDICHRHRLLHRLSSKGHWHLAQEQQFSALDGAGGCCRQAAEYRCAPPQQ